MKANTQQPPKCENHAPVAPNEDNVVTERNRSE